jgi:hypothetical protein
VIDCYLKKIKFFVQILDRYALLLRFLNTTTVLQVSRVGIGERVG